MDYVEGAQGADADGGGGYHGRGHSHDDLADNVHHHTHTLQQQRALAQVGKPSYPQDLVSIIKNVKPDILIGAVGVVPNCFTKEVVDAMLAVQDAKPEADRVRPIIFALSNPKTQAEITAEDCYKFSQGRAIFGSGTRFESVQVNGETREPGQVNNFLIFPGMSFGAMKCAATTIPERLFMVAAEAVANCLDARDLKVESVVPHPSRIREVALSVATAVVLESQRGGYAQKQLGVDEASVRAALEAAMWQPSVRHTRGMKQKLSDERDAGPEANAAKSAKTEGITSTNEERQKSDAEKRANDGDEGIPVDTIVEPYPIGLITGLGDSRAHVLGRSIDVQGRESDTTTIVIAATCAGFVILTCLLFCVAEMSKRRREKN